MNRRQLLKSSAILAVPTSVVASTIPAKNQVRMVDRNHVHRLKDGEAGYISYIAIYRDHASLLYLDPDNEVWEENDKYESRVYIEKQDNQIRIRIPESMRPWIERSFPYDPQHLWTTNFIQPLMRQKDGSYLGLNHDDPEWKKHHLNALKLNIIATNPCGLIGIPWKENP
jgi:hypothetical protein